MHLVFDNERGVWYRLSRAIEENGEIIYVKGIGYLKYQVSIPTVFTPTAKTRSSKLIRAKIWDPYKKKWC
ncbi:hypothetical protein HYV31_01130 [candidate division WWE3 bacterium]|nr:hypothetical protein [candidate division WWE3 bacterium]